MEVETTIKKVEKEKKEEEGEWEVTVLRDLRRSSELRTAIPKLNNVWSYTATEGVAC